MRKTFFENTRAVLFALTDKAISRASLTGKAVCRAASLTGKAAILAAACLALSAHGATVTVASGESVTIGSDVPNTNNGTSELVAEAGSTIVLPASETASFWVFTRVYLTGTGTVTLVAPAGDSSATTIVFANGLAAESDNVTLHVDIAGVTKLKVGRGRDKPTDINYPVADIANVTFANENGVFGLREWATARKLPAVVDTGSLVGVALQGTNPLHLTDSFDMTRFDVVALTTDCIPDTCTVTVAPGRTLAVKPCGRVNSGSAYTYLWFWGGVEQWSGKYNVMLGGKGARVLCRNNNKLRLLANISGEGEVVFQPDGNTNKDTFFRGITYTASQSSPVAVPISSATEPEPSTSWQGKVANWFDASEEDTFVKLAIQHTSSSYNGGGMYYTNGFPIIVGWKDKVHGMDGTYLCNRRLAGTSGTYTSYTADYHVETLPYVVTNGLNGMNYVSCGVQGNKVSYPYAKGDNQPEARRLQFHSRSTEYDGKAVPTGGAYEDKTYPYCIMVFGSQGGGGKAILNGKSGTGLGNLARTVSAVSAYWMAYDGYSMVVDGLDANPKTTTPNGGWQIVSLDMTATNTVLLGISGHQGGTYGGMNYAEIIFFREKPTSAERAACEQYLAKKWGLETSYTPWDVGYTELSGQGALTLDDSGWATHEDVAEVTVAGNFAGTINVPVGKTLVVSDRSAPPSLYDVPQQGNLVAWFDPSLDGAIDFHVHPDAATGVARLYSRTAAGVDKTDGAYWMGMNALASDDVLTGTGIGNPGGRYPFLTETSYLSAFGIGTPMKWMDFTQNAPYDGNGNTLRSHRLPLTGNEITNGASTPMTFRSLFMALDTSAGGGNPIGDNVSFNKNIRARASKGADYTKPIWGTGTMAMAHTWLDTNEVDGATTGYNGRAEVLGFETSADFTTDTGLFFGYYNGDGANYNGNCEHIGETLIYNTTLTDAERLAVQEYLMAKWTGDLNGKYSDLSRATVTGAGNVYSASLRNLPSFDSGFTGTLSGGSNMTFTVDSSWDASAAVDAISIDRQLTLDAGKVTVTLKGEAKAGVYTLLTVPSGTLAGKAFDLAPLVNETGKSAQARLLADDTTLSLEILSQGTVLMVR